MTVIILAVLVLILDGAFAAGSMLNGYSMSESFVGSGVRLLIELACLYYITKGKAVGLWVLLSLWGVSIGICLYFSTKADSNFDRYGLLFVSGIIALMSILLVNFTRCRKRDAGQKDQPVNCSILPTNTTRKGQSESAD